MRIHAICVFRLVIGYRSEEAHLGGFVAHGRSVTVGHIMEIQPHLELHKAFCGPIQFVNEESSFFGTIEPHVEMVTHISEAEDVCNTMRVVPHFTGIPREFPHLVGVRPPDVTPDAHVPVGPVHVLEEGLV